MSVAVRDLAAAIEDASGVIPLDPWIEPPGRRALEVMPAQFWREQKWLPLQAGGRHFVVAASAPADPRAMDRLQTAAALPVRLVPGAADEVRFWLDVLLGERTWSEALAAGLAELLTDLGLYAEQHTPLLASPEGALAVDQVAAAFGLDEETAVETLALRARLPQLRLERFTLTPHLRGLMPATLAREAKVVPVVARPGYVLLATPQVPGRARWEQLRATVGLEPRLAICAPEAFRRAFSAVFDGLPEAPPAPLDDAAVLQAMVGLRSLDAAHCAALMHLRDVRDDSPIAAGLRLGYVTAWQVQCARAHLYDLKARPAARLRVAAAAAARGAPALWRRWRCVPVEQSGQSVTLAADGPLPAAVLDVAGYLLAAGTVAAEYSEPEDLERALQTLPPPSPEPLTAERFLEDSGRVSATQMAAAQRHALRLGGTVLDALLAQQTVGVEDAVEARAVVLGRPWIRLARYAPLPAVAALIPEDTARAELALPLLRHGASLTVALLNGRDGPAAGAFEQATGLAIDSVLAVAADPAAACDRWYRRRAAQIPESYAEFGRTIVRSGRLSQVQLEQAWDAVSRDGLALDRALCERGLLSPSLLVQLLADYLRVDQATLDPVPQWQEIVDALGERRMDQRWLDPVDRDVARQISGTLAQRLGAIPLRLTGDAVEVAFANPLDDAAIDALAAAYGHPVRACVATRAAIELAQRRVFASRSVGERLLLMGVITQEQLRRALSLHDETGVRVGQALVNLGYVSEMEMAATVAEQAGLAFVDLRAAQPDPEAACLLPREFEREHGLLPLFDRGEALVVACTDLPAACGVDEAQARLARPLEPVIVTESTFDDALNALYRDAYLAHSATDLVSRSPEDSARWVLSRPQKIGLVAGTTLATLGLGLYPTITATWLIVLSTAFYVTFSAYKFYLTYKAVAHTLEIETTAEEVAALDSRHLPVYTLLVPVYREAEVLPILARAINRLDYPKAKLDVKILLEEDDLETIQVARESHLPSHFKLVVVPHGRPKGKPKACNYGLIHARGEFVVIYDAEDLPEPDQLKKAIVGFQKGDERLACVQAKLNYFNRNQNLLTRWFTTEYSMWFDLFLPGLDASNAPIPLGGTSNHFKTARLRDLGAWDPYNVTEDADLGMRLYKAGWKTAVIDSTTYEEANSELYNWIRQRSRWVKGYIQTYLVHMRHPVRLWRAIGPRAFFSFQLVVGGTFFGFLVNPLFWVLTALWYTTHWAFIKQIFPAPIYYLGSIGLYFGNFAFTYLNIVGCMRRGYYDMVKYALLTPLYWALMSVAAWKGFLQLFYAPSYWEKTKHGLYKGEVATPQRVA